MSLVVNNSLFKQKGNEMLHKTKIAGLTLLISALCMQSVYSWSNAVINDTNAEIEVVFAYVGCKGKVGYLQPKQIVNDPAGLCRLNFIDLAKIIDRDKRLVVRHRFIPRDQAGSHTIRVTDTRDAQGGRGIIGFEERQRQ